MFCFPIASNLPHDSPTIWSLSKEIRGRQEEGGPERFLETPDALAAGSIFPLLLDHPVVAAKGLVELGSSSFPAPEQMLVELQVEVVPS